jgi:hypothetical protein
MKDDGRWTMDGKEEVKSTATADNSGVQAVFGALGWLFWYAWERVCAVLTGVK